MSMTTLAVGLNAPSLPLLPLATCARPASGRSKVRRTARRVGKDVFIGRVSAVFTGGRQPPSLRGRLGERASAVQSQFGMGRKRAGALSAARAVSGERTRPAEEAEGKSGGRGAGEPCWFRRPAETNFPRRPLRKTRPFFQQLRGRKFAKAGTPSPARGTRALPGERRGRRAGADAGRGIMDSDAWFARWVKAVKIMSFPQAALPSAAKKHSR